MTEFFIVANSFAAPFCSDTSEHFYKGKNASDALTRFAKRYDHPAGLYSAAAWKSADDYHRNKKAVAQLLCNLQVEKEKATKKKKSSYTFRNVGINSFEVDGVLHTVENPRGFVITP